MFTAQAIDWIATACIERISKPGVSRLAGIEDIIDKDYSLSVSLYVRAEQESTATDLGAIRYRRKKLRDELSEVNQRIDALLDNVMAQRA